MQGRETSIRVSSDSLNLSNASIEKLLQKARYKRTKGNSSTGAYCSENIRHVSFQKTTLDGTSYYDIEIEYRESKSQKNYVTKTTKKLVKKIKSKTKIEKINYIVDWMVQNLSYEIDSNSAYLALTTGKANCLGYALLFQKMATEVGIESRIIRGHVGDVYHAWNVVKVDGKWYYLDVTYVDDGNTWDNHYFLFGSNFCNAHRTIEDKAAYKKLAKRVSASNYYK
jgi:transglutaminase/protease-like cytokinesis protein 3